MPWSVLWALTLAVFALNAFAAWRDFRNYGDELGASALLVLLLEVSMLLNHERALVAVFDLGALALTAWWFWTRPQVWSFTLAFLFLVQLWGHAGFAGANNSHGYTAFLNVTNVLQLAALGFPGGRYAVARAFDAGLRSRWARHLRSVGHQ